MARIEHKDWGIGEIITREGNRMTVRFNKVGKEIKMNIPKSFVLGIYKIDEELQKEVVYVVVPDDHPLRCAGHIHL